MTVLFSLLAFAFCSGSFGEIRVGVHIKRGIKIAAKLEPIDCRLPQLKIEHAIYSKLKSENGFPVIYYFGQCEKYNVLVMQLLGQNLEQVFDLCKRQFSLKTILYVAIQLITRFEAIHRNGYSYIYIKNSCTFSVIYFVIILISFFSIVFLFIFLICRIVYRDVKPENFMFGLEKNANTLYVIDFGLSKSYLDANNQHIPAKKSNHYTGTARYMSLNAHRCLEQSRRDDLESIGYVLLYILRQGKLPWSGFQGLELKEQYQKIYEYKYSIPIETLCLGFPVTFSNYLRFV